MKHKNSAQGKGTQGNNQKRKLAPVYNSGIFPDLRRELHKQDIVKFFSSFISKGVLMESLLPSREVEIIAQKIYSKSDTWQLFGAKFTPEQVNRFGVKSNHELFDLLVEENKGNPTYTYWLNIKEIFSKVTKIWEQKFNEETREKPRN